MLGEIGDRRRGRQRMRWLDGITESESEKKVKVKSLSRVQLFATPWTVAYQASPSMGFSRQECWSGLPFPSPGDLYHPGIEPESSALVGGFFTTNTIWEALVKGISQSISQFSHSVVSDSL